MFRIIRAFRNNRRDFQKQRFKGFVVERRMPLQDFCLCERYPRSGACHGRYGD